MRKLKNNLQKEGRNFVPNIKEKLVREIGIGRRKPLLYFAPLGACLIIFLIYILKPTVVPPLESTFLTIDINPSIELEIKDDEIINVRSLNKDGAILLADYKEVIINNDVNKAVNNITQLAIEIGYLDDEGEMTIDVIDNNEKTEENIFYGIDQDLKNKYSDLHINFNRGNNEIKTKADKYNISVGRMQLIERAIASDKTLNLKKALKMPISKLNEIIRDYAHEEVEIVISQYNNKVARIKNIRDITLNEFTKSKESLNFSINQINEMLDNNIPLSRIKIIIEPILQLLELEVEIKNKIQVRMVLEDLESIIDEYDFKIELINESYYTQINAYKMQANNYNNLNIKFNFNENFSFLPNSGNNQNEKEILRLINQIYIKMDLVSNNKGNLSNFLNQIDELYMKYNNLKDNENIEDEFLLRNDIIEFETEYQKFINNWQN